MPTSTSSSTASCVFDVDSGCRRRNRQAAAARRRAPARAELTLSITETTNRMLAELPEDFLAANGKAGSPVKP
jgi:hypothetical protein